MKLKKYLGDRVFWQASLRLGLPIALQNLLVSSFALIDTVMIGVLGRNALAAVGMAGQWSWLMNLVFFGFNSGASVFYAQYWGIKNMKGIHRTFGLALVSGLAAAIVFMTVGLVAPEMVMRIFTSEEAVIAEGVVYLRYACFSYVAISLNNIFCTILRSTEHVKLPLYASAISVAGNAIFNALFIFGLKMGVKGAAIATSLSALISPIILLLVSLRQKNTLCARLSDMFAWGGGFVKKYYRISLPVLFNESLWALGTVLYRIMFSRKSTDFYAAYTILGSVEGLIFSFFVGLCHACAVQIGKQVGSGDFEGAYTDGVRYGTLVPLTGLVCGVVVIALRNILLLPFAGGQEQAVLDTASVLMIIYGLELWIRNIPYIAVVGIFRAGGDTRIGLAYDLGCLWGMTLPLVFVLTNYTNLALTVVFLLMLLCEDVLKSFLCLRRLVSRKWIKPVTGEAADIAAGIPD